MIDEAYGMDEPCLCCGRSVDDCICEACPECEEYGNPVCYIKHGMKYSEDQLSGQQKLKDQIEADRKVDDAMYKEYMKDQEIEHEDEDFTILKYDDKEVFRSNSDE
jgi:hypothetical protein